MLFKNMKTGKAQKFNKIFADDLKLPNILRIGAKNRVRQIFKHFNEHIAHFIRLFLRFFNTGNVRNHSVKNRGIILIVFLNGSIKFTPFIFIFMNYGSYFQIALTVSSHSLSDSLKNLAFIIRMNKLIQAVNLLTVR